MLMSRPPRAPLSLAIVSASSECSFSTINGTRAMNFPYRKSVLTFLDGLERKLKDRRIINDANLYLYYSYSYNACPKAGPEQVRRILERLS
jgi:hypothetical protein